MNRLSQSLLLLLLVSCAVPSTGLADDGRVYTDELVSEIAAWPVGTSGAAKWAMNVVVPDRVSAEDLERIREALARRHYGIPPSEPIVVACVACQSLVALADPVDQPEVFLSFDVARALVRARIPFGFEEVGASQTLILPRRAIPAARSALDPLLPSATTWRE